MTEEKYRIIKSILLAVFVVGSLAIALRFTSIISESSSKLAENGRYIQIDVRKSKNMSGTPLIDTRTGESCQATEKDLTKFHGSTQ